jgi:hypothetical protein
MERTKQAEVSCPATTETREQYNYIEKPQTRTTNSNRTRLNHEMFGQSKRRRFMAGIVWVK